MQRWVVDRPTTAADLRTACGQDPYVVAETEQAAALRAWVGGGAAAWRSVRIGGSASWVTVVGDPVAAAPLVATAVRELRADGLPPTGLTVPRAAMARLPADVHPGGGEDWDWLWSRTAPPAQPGEDAVGWLDDVPDGRLADFLAAASPRHSAVPGSRGVRRWCGVRDSAGRLLATAAHTEHVAGVPHLASIAVLPSLRGRGYGAAATAWLTRSLLASYGVVTLGMYADNEPARRMYRRLGYRDEHRFTSGRYPRS